MRPLKAQSIALALLALTSASAPVLAEGRTPRITAMGGMTIASLRVADDPLDVFQSMKGLAAGVGFAWRMGASLEFQPELLYMQKGFSFGESEGTDPFGNPTGTFEELTVVDAIEVPLLLQWEIPTGGRVHPVLLGGPFVSFEVREQRKLTGSEELSIHTGLLNDTDYGMALGAGLAVDAGRGSWILQGRYDAGFADLGSNTGYGAVHSSAWVILTGYRF